MATSSTIPEQTKMLLDQLRKRHPNHHWSISQDIGSADGYYLTTSDRDYIRTSWFRKGVNVLELSDKLVAKPEEDSQQ